MDQNLIDKIKSVTGKDDDAVQQMLDNASIDQMYGIIDSARKNDTQGLQQAIKPLQTDSDHDTTNPVDQNGTRPTTPQKATTTSTTTGTNPSVNAAPTANTNGSNPTHPTTSTGTDATNAGSDNSVGSDDVEEAMKKPPAPIKVPAQKPRDPMARELTKGQYQPKVTPGKKERLARMDAKHKGRDPFDKRMGESAVLGEMGVMGMTAMPAIKKMLSLAGRPIDEEAIAKAMEDYMGDFADYEGLSINDLTQPVGTTIPAGALDGALAAFVGDDEEQDAFDAELDAMAPMDDMTPGELTHIQCIRDAFASIESSLSGVTLGEFGEVREMLANLVSRIDRLGNSVSGK